MNRNRGREVSEVFDTPTITPGTLIIAAIGFLLALVTVVSLGVHFNSVN
jgi:hypothetical protein